MKTPRDDDDLLAFARTLRASSLGGDARAVAVRSRALALAVRALAAVPVTAVDRRRDALLDLARAFETYLAGEARDSVTIDLDAAERDDVPDPPAEVEGLEVSMPRVPADDPTRGWNARLVLALETLRDASPFAAGDARLPAGITAARANLAREALLGRYPRGAEAEAALRAADAERDRLSGLLATARAELAEATASSRDFSAEVDRLEAERDDLEAERDDLARRLRAAAATEEALEMRVREAEADRDDLRVRLTRALAVAGSGYPDLAHPLGGFPGLPPGAEPTAAVVATGIGEPANEEDADPGDFGRTAAERVADLEARMRAALPDDLPPLTAGPALADVDPRLRRVLLDLAFEYGHLGVARVALKMLHAVPAGREYRARDVTATPDEPTVVSVASGEPVSPRSGRPEPAGPLWPHEVPVVPLGPPRVAPGLSTTSATNAALDAWWREHLDRYHGAAARAGLVARVARAAAAHHGEDGRTWDDLVPAEREHWRRYAATLLAEDDRPGAEPARPARRSRMPAAGPGGDDPGPAGPGGGS